MFREAQREGSWGAFRVDLEDCGLGLRVLFPLAWLRIYAHKRG